MGNYVIHINNLELSENHKRWKINSNPPALWGRCHRHLLTFREGQGDGSATVVYPASSLLLLLVFATMSSGGGKQAPKIVSKSSAGGTGAAGAGGGPPVMPLASPLMGKKKKPFLGMPAPLGYVPGLGRG